jgi:hypothetical protein
VNWIEVAADLVHAGLFENGNEHLSFLIGLEIS